MDNLIADIYDKDTGEIVKENADLLEITKTISKKEHIRNISRLNHLWETDKSKLSLDDLVLLMKLAKRPSTIPNRIKLDFGEDGYFTCKRDLNMVLELHDYTKAFLYSVSHMITHDGRLKYGNNRMIPNLGALKKYLKISNDKWNKFIKPDIDKYHIATKEKIDNKWCILLNPLFARSSDFEMTIDVYNSFKDCILKNARSFINSVKTKYVFEYIKDDFKKHLSEYEYNFMDFTFSEKSYTVLESPVAMNGVYILYNDSEIIYIGKSKNMKNRIKEHKKDKIFNDTKCIVFKDEGLVNLYEPYLIQKYRPRYNRDLLEITDFNLPEITL